MDKEKSKAIETLKFLPQEFLAILTRIESKILDDPDAWGVKNINEYIETIRCMERELITLEDDGVFGPA